MRFYQRKEITIKKMSHNQIRMYDILGLIIKINEKTNYFGFFSFDGNTGEASYSVYQPTHGEFFVSFPEISMHGIGVHRTFDEAEDELSKFLMYNMRKGENDE